MGHTEEEIVDIQKYQRGAVLAAIKRSAYLARTTTPKLQGVGVPESATS